MKNQTHFVPAYRALKKGADLWVLSTIDHYNLWYATIDWYLNFQLRRQKEWTVDSDTQGKWESIFKQYDLTPFQWKKPKIFPTLIDSSQWLPNRWIMELAYTQNWQENIQTIWTNLNCPTLRIFIPQPMNTEQVDHKIFKDRVEYVHH